MLKEIPKVIYDMEGAPLRVAKYSKIVFKDRNEEGYILHVEKAERVTAVGEFDLKEVDGKFFLTREIFKESATP